MLTETGGLLTAMTTLTVTIRDEDVAVLDALCDRQWRNRDQQASAIVEAALNVERARANPSAVVRRGPRRSANGVTGVPAAAH